MSPEDESYILEAWRKERSKRRGYADFFGWRSDRDLEEWGVATALRETLEASGEPLFSGLKARGRGNDPPDCEATDADGRRMAIELTELVDGLAIHAARSGAPYDWAHWPKAKFLAALSELLLEKGKRYPVLKGGPYEGGYLVLIYTDEPGLTVEDVQGYLAGHTFSRPAGVDRALLLMSYDPRIERYPYFDLAFGN